MPTTPPMSSCRCRSTWPTHGREAVRGAQDRAPLTTCAPTAKPSSTLGYDGDEAGVDREHRRLDPARGTREPGPAAFRDQGLRHRSGHRRFSVSTTLMPTSTSTRPVPSSPADRWVMPDSPVARSSSTPTAATPATVEVPSPARTRRRSTALLPMPCAGWRRTSSRPGSPTAPRCRSPTPSAVVDPMGLYVETFGTEKVDPNEIAEGDSRGLRSATGRDHPGPQPPASHLLPDFDVRALRPHGADLTWERTDRADDLLRAVSSA